MRSSTSLAAKGLQAQSTSTFHRSFRRLRAIADLQQQLKSIQAEIESRRISARSEVRADIEQMLKDADLTLSDVFPELAKGVKAAAAKAKKSSDVAAKYKDPTSGSLWSGRGRSPKWVEAILKARGINIKEFKQLSEFAA